MWLISFVQACAGCVFSVHGGLYTFNKMSLYRNAPTGLYVDQLIKFYDQRLKPYLCSPRSGS